MPLTVVTPHNLRYTEYRMDENLTDRITVRAIVIARLTEAGNSPDVIQSFADQADKGDYQHFLRVVMAFTEEPDDDYGFHEGPLGDPLQVVQDEYDEDDPIYDDGHEH